ncbi:MAG: hypothetical protein HKN25_04410, partial [Pyrinomonadaceae bacterium]|nr:hypothetical protein [Pyrinomonadaceae bacterium]
LEGFRSVLPHGVYPVAFLFLEIPLEEVDVNVHPAKTEVRFRRAQAVKDAIAEAVRDTLRNAGIVGDHNAESGPGPLTAEDAQTDFTQTSDVVSEKVKARAQGQSAGMDQHPPDQQSSIDFEISAESQEFESTALNRAESTARADELVENFNADHKASSRPDQFEVPAFFSTEMNSADLPPVDSAAAVPKAVEIGDISPSKIQPIAQLHESFIVAFDDEGLLLIDQHVAHERILFDKFRKMEMERKTESQNLLLPETIDLTPAQAAAFEEIQSDLEACGFGLMKLSGRTVAIKSIPTDLPQSEVGNLFSEILDTIEKERRGGARKTFRDDIAASMACKAAVKINMKLTPEKMQWMIDNLLASSSPTTCPHGRPVVLRLTMKDIERKFHRT